MEDLFRHLETLTTLPVATRQILNDLFRPLHLPRHAYFVKAGERTDDIAFIQNGVLRAFWTSADGVEYNKTFFTEGDLMGIYYALLRKRPSHLSVQALTPCTLQVASFSRIETLYDDHPAIERLARVQAEHLFLIKEQREIDLVMLDAKARYEKLQQEYPGLEQRIPQYHIASHLGITPTQLSRIRAQLPE